MALKTVTCRSCGEQYDHRRRQLGYNFCLDCGDFRAQQVRSSWCIAPIEYVHKPMSKDELAKVKQIKPRYMRHTGEGS